MDVGSLISSVFSKLWGDCSLVNHQQQQTGHTLHLIDISDSFLRNTCLCAWVRISCIQMSKEVPAPKVTEHLSHNPFLFVTNFIVRRCFEDSNLTLSFFKQQQWFQKLQANMVLAVLIHNTLSLCYCSGKAETDKLQQCYVAAHIDRDIFNCIAIVYINGSSLEVKVERPLQVNQKQG